MAGAKKKKPTPQNPNTELDVFWHFGEVFFCLLAFVLHNAVFFLLMATSKCYGTWDAGCPGRASLGDCQLEASEWLGPKLPVAD